MVLSRLKLLRFGAGIVLFLFFSFACSEGKPSQLFRSKAITGFDLPTILKNGKLRVLAENSSTSYFIYRGKKMGFEYEMLREFARELGVELEIITVDNLDDMDRMLNRGEGDLIACNYTISIERKKEIDFTVPYLTTKQVLVQQKPLGWENLDKETYRRKVLHDPTQLARKKISVWKNSSYHQRLVNLQEEIGDSIYIQNVSGDFSAEDLIEQVSEGTIPYTVVEKNVAEVNSKFYDNIDVDLEISFNQRIAFGVRKTSPLLKAKMNEWLQRFVQQPSFKYDNCMDDETIDTRELSVKSYDQHNRRFHKPIRVSGLEIVRETETYRQPIITSKPITPMPQHVEPEWHEDHHDDEAYEDHVNEAYEDYDDEANDEHHVDEANENNVHPIEEEEYVDDDDDAEEESDIKAWVDRQLELHDSPQWDDDKDEYANWKVRNDNVEETNNTSEESEEDFEVCQDAQYAATEDALNISDHNQLSVMRNYRQQRVNVNDNLPQDKQQYGRQSVSRNKSIESSLCNDLYAKMNFPSEVEENDVNDGEGDHFREISNTTPCQNKDQESKNNLIHENQLKEQQRYTCKFDKENQPNEVDANFVDRQVMEPKFVPPQFIQTKFKPQKRLYDFDDDDDDDDENEGTNFSKNDDDTMSTISVSPLTKLQEMQRKKQQEAVAKRLPKNFTNQRLLLDL